MFRWIKSASSEKSKADLRLIRFLIKQFGYRPKKLRLFKEALTHKSISNKKEGLNSNERLEFLGDTILDAVVAEFLFSKFPEEDEGYLTKLKAKIVSRKTLGSIGSDMQLREFIHYQKGRSVKVETLEGNAFEAIIGAIYLDGGFDAAKKSIAHHVFRIHLDLTSLLENEIDFKSKLFIWSQKNRLDIEFRLIREEINNGVWHYETEVYVNSKPYGRGVGASKKIAEQAASKETLTLMGEV